MYAGAPLALGALRKQKPDLPRPYRLPAAGVLAPLAFVLAHWIIVYWAGWQTYTTLMVAMLIGYALIAVSAASTSTPSSPEDRLGGGGLDRPVPDRDGRHLLLGRVRSAAGSSAASASSRHVLDQAAPTTSGCGAGSSPRRSFSLVIYYWASPGACPAPRSTNTCARSIRRRSPSSACAAEAGPRGAALYVGRSARSATASAKRPSAVFSGRRAALELGHAVAHGLGMDVQALRDLRGVALKVQPRAQGSSSRSRSAGASAWSGAST